MLRNGSMPTRPGVRAGRASWRRKHAGLTEGGNTPTKRLVRARNSLNKLISQGLLFTYLDPTWTHQMPTMTNQIESTNARLRQMLRDHRGMRLTRRMKAVVLVVLHPLQPTPQPAATILAPCPPTQPSKTPGTKPVKPAKPPAPSPAGATQFAGTNSTTPPPTTTPGTNPSNTKCPITRHCRGPLKIAVVEVRSSSRTSTSTHNPRPIPGHPHSTRKSRK